MNRLIEYLHCFIKVFCHQLRLHRRILLGCAWRVSRDVSPEEFSHSTRLVTVRCARSPKSDFFITRGLRWRQNLRYHGTSEPYIYFMQFLFACNGENYIEIALKLSRSMESNFNNQIFLKHLLNFYLHELESRRIYSFHAYAKISA